MAYVLIFFDSITTTEKGGIIEILKNKYLLVEIFNVVVVQKMQSNDLNMVRALIMFGDEYHIWLLGCMKNMI